MNENYDYKYREENENFSFSYHLAKKILFAVLIGIAIFLNIQMAKSNGISKVFAQGNSLDEEGKKPILSDLLGEDLFIFENAESNNKQGSYDSKNGNTYTLKMETAFDANAPEIRGADRDELIYTRDGIIGVFDLYKWVEKEDVRNKVGEGYFTDDEIRLQNPIYQYLEMELNGSPIYEDVYKAYKWMPKITQVDIPSRYIRYEGEGHRLNFNQSKGAVSQLRQNDLIYNYLQRARLVNVFQRNGQTQPEYLFDFQENSKLSNDNNGYWLKDSSDFSGLFYRQKQIADTISVDRNGKVFGQAGFEQRSYYEINNGKSVFYLYNKEGKNIGKFTKYEPNNALVRDGYLKENLIDGSFSYVDSAGGRNFISISVEEALKKGSSATLEYLFNTNGTLKLPLSNREAEAIRTQYSYELEVEEKVLQLTDLGFNWFEKGGVKTGGDEYYNTGRKKNKYTWKLYEAEYYQDIWLDYNSKEHDNYKSYWYEGSWTLESYEKANVSAVRKFQSSKDYTNNANEGNYKLWGTGFEYGYRVEVVEKIVNGGIKNTLLTMENNSYSNNKKAGEESKEYSASITRPEFETNYYQRKQVSSNIGVYEMLQAPSKDKVIYGSGSGWSTNSNINAHSETKKDSDGREYYVSSGNEGLFANKKQENGISVDGTLYKNEWVYDGSEEYRLNNQIEYKDDRNYWDVVSTTPYYNYNLKNVRSSQSFNTSSTYTFAGNILNNLKGSKYGDYYGGTYRGSDYISTGNNSGAKVTSYGYYDFELTYYKIDVRNTSTRLGTNVWRDERMTFYMPASAVQSSWRRNWTASKYAKDNNSHLSDVLYTWTYGRKSPSSYSGSESVSILSYTSLMSQDTTKAKSTIDKWPSNRGASSWPKAEKITKMTYKYTNVLAKQTPSYSSTDIGSFKLGTGKSVYDNSTSSYITSNEFYKVKFATAVYKVTEGGSNGTTGYSTTTRNNGQKYSGSITNFNIINGDATVGYRKRLKNLKSTPLSGYNFRHAQTRFAPDQLNAANIPKYQTRNVTDRIYDSAVGSYGQIPQKMSNPAAVRFGKPDLDGIYSYDIYWKVERNNLAYYSHTKVSINNYYDVGDLKPMGTPTYLVGTRGKAGLYNYHSFTLTDSPSRDSTTRITTRLYTGNNANLKATYVNNLSDTYDLKTQIDSANSVYKHNYDVSGGRIYSYEIFNFINTKTVVKSNLGNQYYSAQQSTKELILRKGQTTSGDYNRFSNTPNANDRYRVTYDLYEKVKTNIKLTAEYKNNLGNYSFGQITNKQGTPSYYGNLENFNVTRDGGQRIDGILEIGNPEWSWNNFKILKGLPSEKAIVKGYKVVDTKYSESNIDNLSHQPLPSGTKFARWNDNIHGIGKSNQHDSAWKLEGIKEYNEYKIAKIKEVNRRVKAEKDVLGVLSNDLSNYYAPNGGLINTNQNLFNIRNWVRELNKENNTAYLTYGSNKYKVGSLKDQFSGSLTLNSSNRLILNKGKNVLSAKASGSGSLVVKLKKTNGTVIATLNLSNGVNNVIFDVTEDNLIVSVEISTNTNNKEFEWIQIGGGSTFNGYVPHKDNNVNTNYIVNQETKKAYSEDRELFRFDETMIYDLVTNEEKIQLTKDYLSGKNPSDFTSRKLDASNTIAINGSTDRWLRINTLNKYDRYERKTIVTYEQGGDNYQRNDLVNNGLVDAIGKKSENYYYRNGDLPGINLGRDYYGKINFLNTGNGSLMGDEYLNSLKAEYDKIVDIKYKKQNVIYLNGTFYIVEDSNDVWNEYILVGDYRDEGNWSLEILTYGELKELAKQNGFSLSGKEIVPENNVEDDENGGYVVYAGENNNEIILRDYLITTPFDDELNLGRITNGYNYTVDSTIKLVKADENEKVNRRKKYEIFLPDPNGHWEFVKSDVRKVDYQKELMLYLTSNKNDNKYVQGGHNIGTFLKNGDNGTSLLYKDVMGIIDALGDNDRYAYYSGMYIKLDEKLVLRKQEISWRLKVRKTGDIVRKVIDPILSGNNVVSDGYYNRFNNALSHNGVYFDERIAPLNEYRSGSTLKRKANGKRGTFRFESNGQVAIFDELMDFAIGDNQKTNVGILYQVISDNEVIEYYENLKDFFVERELSNSTSFEKFINTQLLSFKEDENGKIIFKDSGNVNNLELIEEKISKTGWLWWEEKTWVGIYANKQDQPSLISQLDSLVPDYGKEFTIVEKNGVKALYVHLEKETNPFNTITWNEKATFDTGFYTENSKDRGSSYIEVLNELIKDEEIRRQLSESNFLDFNPAQKIDLGSDIVKYRVSYNTKRNVQIRNHHNPGLTSAVIDEKLKTSININIENSKMDLSDRDYNKGKTNFDNGKFEIELNDEIKNTIESLEFAFAYKSGSNWIETDVEVEDDKGNKKTIGKWTNMGDLRGNNKFEELKNNSNVFGGKAISEIKYAPNSDYYKIDWGIKDLQGNRNIPIYLDAKRHSNTIWVLEKLQDYINKKDPDLNYLTPLYDEKTKYKFPLDNEIFRDIVFESPIKPNRVILAHKRKAAYGLVSYVGTEFTLDYRNGELHTGNHLGSKPKLKDFPLVPEFDYKDFALYWDDLQISFNNPIVDRINEKEGKKYATTTRHEGMAVGRFNYYGFHIIINDVRLAFDEGLHSHDLSIRNKHGDGANNLWHTNYQLGEFLEETPGSEWNWFEHGSKSTLSPGLDDDKNLKGVPQITGTSFMTDVYARNRDVKGQYKSLGGYFKSFDAGGTQETFSVGMPMPAKDLSHDELVTNINTYKELRDSNRTSLDNRFFEADKYLSASSRLTRGGILPVRGRVLSDDTLDIWSNSTNRAANKNNEIYKMFANYDFSNKDILFDLNYAQTRTEVAYSANSVARKELTFRESISYDKIGTPDTDNLILLGASDAAKLAETYFLNLKKVDSTAIYKHNGVSGVELDNKINSLFGSEFKINTKLNPNTEYTLFVRPRFIDGSTTDNAYTTTYTFKTSKDLVHNPWGEKWKGESYSGENWWKNPILSVDDAEKFFTYGNKLWVGGSVDNMLIGDTPEQYKYSRYYDGDKRTEQIPIQFRLQLDFNKDKRNVGPEEMAFHIYEINKLIDKGGDVYEADLTNITFKDASKLVFEDPNSGNKFLTSNRMPGLSTSDNKKSHNLNSNEIYYLYNDWVKKTYPDKDALWLTKFYYNVRNGLNNEKLTFAEDILLNKELFNIYFANRGATKNNIDSNIPDIGLIENNKYVIRYEYLFDSYSEVGYLDYNQDGINSKSVNINDGKNFYDNDSKTLYNGFSEELGGAFQIISVPKGSSGQKGFIDNRFSGKVTLHKNEIRMFVKYGVNDSGISESRYYLANWNGTGGGSILVPR